MKPIKTLDAWTIRVQPNFIKKGVWSLTSKLYFRHEADSGRTGEFLIHCSSTCFNTRDPGHLGTVRSNDSRLILGLIPQGVLESRETKLISWLAMKTNQEVYMLSWKANSQMVYLVIPTASMQGWLFLSFYFRGKKIRPRHLNLVV